MTIIATAFTGSNALATLIGRTALALLLVAPLAAQCAGAGAGAGADALRAEYRQLATELQRSALGGLIHLQSQESEGFAQGHIHAVLNHPFAAARSALAEAPAWCDLLLLTSNVKACDSRGGTPALVALKVANTARQPADEAPVLGFQWRRTMSEPDYLRVEMSAAEGPAGTRNYRLDAQLVELDPARTFLRLSYEFSYSTAGRVAIQLYLATIARAKVGFTVEDGQPVRGLRGVVERNTMRYFLSLRTYLEGSANALPLETLLGNWYAAADRYPAQLRELTREEYLEMKRAEFAAHRRQPGSP